MTDLTLLKKSLRNAGRTLSESRRPISVGYQVHDASVPERVRLLITGIIL